MVVGGCRGCRFGNRFLLLFARGGEFVFLRFGIIGSRCIIKLVV